MKDKEKARLPPFSSMNREMLLAGCVDILC